MEGFGKEV